MGLEKTISLDEIKNELEARTDNPIIHIDRTYHGVIHFITEDLDNKYYLDLSLVIANQKCRTTTYDPLTNYIYRCKECHSFNHNSCKKKLCTGCHRENCKKPCPNNQQKKCLNCNCLLYTSPSPRDRTRSRMPSSA